MRVVVTGANGQVGRAVLALAALPYECIALGRNELDLIDGEQIERVVAELRPDWVVNAAAFTAVDAAESDPALAMAVNAEAPAAFARALEQTGGRLLQLSSDYVFDGNSTQPYRPDDPTAPLSAYGRSKARGESAAGPNALVLRTSWIYAEEGRNFVTAMLARMREDREVRVVTDQIGSPSWAVGVARTIWALINRDVSGIWHHRDAGQASWYDFALAIAEDATELGLLDRLPSVVPIATEDYSSVARRPRFSVLDDSATRALLGDEAVPWRANLWSMLEQLHAHGRGQMADGMVHPNG